MAAKDRDAYLAQVYGAENPGDLETAYDEWADSYDRHMAQFGYRYPAAIGIYAGRHFDPRGGPLLEAGVGTGLIGEALAIAGYDEIDGIDLSEGMLRIARARGVYRRLRRMVLGEPLDFADDAYAGCYSAGTLTIGHAPPRSLIELARITRAGGHVIFTNPDPSWHDGGFREQAEALSADGRWRHVESSAPQVSCPSAAAENAHPARIHVFEVL